MAIRTGAEWPRANAMAEIQQQMMDLQSRLTAAQLPKAGAVGLPGAPGSSARKEAADNGRRSASAASDLFGPAVCYPQGHVPPEVADGRNAEQLGSILEVIRELEATLAGLVDEAKKEKTQSRGGEKADELSEILDLVRELESRLVAMIEALKQGPKPAAPTRGAGTAPPPGSTGKPAKEEANAEALGSILDIVRKLESLLVKLIESMKAEQDEQPAPSPAAGKSHGKSHGKSNGKAEPSAKAMEHASPNASFKRDQHAAAATATSGNPLQEILAAVRSLEAKLVELINQAKAEPPPVTQPKTPGSDRAAMRQITSILRELRAMLREALQGKEPTEPSPGGVAGTSPSTTRPEPATKIIMDALAPLLKQIRALQNSLGTPGAAAPGGTQGGERVPQTPARTDAVQDALSDESSPFNAILKQMVDLQEQFSGSQSPVANASAPKAGPSAPSAPMLPVRHPGGELGELLSLLREVRALVKQAAGLTDSRGTPPGPHVEPARPGPAGREHPVHPTHPTHPTHPVKGPGQADGSSQVMEKLSELLKELRQLLAQLKQAKPGGEGSTPPDGPVTEVPRTNEPVAPMGAQPTDTGEPSGIRDVAQRVLQLLDELAKAVVDQFGGPRKLMRASERGVEAAAGAANDANAQSGALQVARADSSRR